MQKTQTFIQRVISGETVLIPAGKTAHTFNGMITLDAILFINQLLRAGMVKPTGKNW